MLLAQVGSALVIHAEVLWGFTVAIMHASLRKIPISHLNLANFLTLTSCFALLHHSNFLWSELLLTHICSFAFTCCHTPVRKGGKACQCSCYPDAHSIHHHHRNRKTSICMLRHWHHPVCTIALSQTHAHSLFSVPKVLTKQCRRPSTWLRCVVMTVSSTVICPPHTVWFADALVQTHHGGERHHKFRISSPSAVPVVGTPLRAVRNPCMQPQWSESEPVL